MTEMPHGAAASAGPDHIPVIVHRLHGKLHESAVPALTEGEIHSPLRLQLLPGGDILSAGGHVVKDTEAGQCAAAGNAHSPLRHAYLLIFLILHFFFLCLLYYLDPFDTGSLRA